MSAPSLQKLGRRLLPVLVVLGLVGLVIAIPAGTAKVIPASQRALAPAFSLPDLTGEPRELASFRGKPVLLNFWAEWCPPCRAELPEVEALAKAHPNCLQVLGVTESSSSLGMLAAFAHAHGLTYPIVRDDAGVGTRYGVRTIPHSVLIDSQGRIATTFDGVITQSQVESALGAGEPSPLRC